MLLTSSERRLLLALILLLAFGYAIDLLGIRPAIETPPVRQELPPIEESPIRQGKIDLNRADSRALQSLPGIGPAMAGRILDYRRERGPFRDVVELLQIRGVGEKTLERLQPYLCIDKNSPPDSCGSF
ncbi:MAG: helix-hairpin-helix domain-containing protein [Candidatus Eisenbacteria bacterium]|uniref:Helix-hairpin-helix domain-containing protein n=1 Tax=Eiseniibacteriota bacterium TaxID=2212470 RepID=A0A948W6S6_UNCEI|nr:helix-hairpin-helix domain-containing protein [Candidatus Eisenbacteria bacterium]MBU1948004.1 helix-hairpin-helix domain-containing protein [Candidatus Eisenbacteria bacterium]MBU2691435.1 helix-hairpin-helix domain-containing protein [Candidatus Eisenbacteria bacterium]